MTGKSDRAKALLEDELLQQAFQDVRDSLAKSFFETPIEDSEKLLNLRIYAHLLEGVKANLEQAIEDGELEDFIANQEETNV